jgi:NAD(P)-dependent dehydrogenase (short-subunit alcohol dehydrogenase family)
MKIDLAGKTALVSGSTAGIGFAIAAGLAGTGARTIVNGRSDKTVEAAVAKLKQAHPGAEIEGIAADLSGAEGCDRLISALPKIDILVNNAGIFEPKDFFEIPDADWARFFETNVMSGVRLSRAYMPGMLERNWGRIVFISSESALQTPKEMIHYGFTKTAQLAISRGVEAFLQAMAKHAGTSADEMAANFVKEHRSTSLLQRFITVEEVANMVVYACSKEASATNGAALRVEGGVVQTLA